MYGTQVWYIPRRLSPVKSQPDLRRLREGTPRSGYNRNEAPSAGTRHPGHDRVAWAEAARFRQMKGKAPVGALPAGAQKGKGYVGRSRETGCSLSLDYRAITRPQARLRATASSSNTCSGRINSPRMPALLSSA